jgi:hypothetical protein
MPNFANILKEISVKASLCTVAAKDDKVEVSCPVCRQRLRLRRHRVGTVSCPRCRDRFEADTNTFVISDIDFGELNIEPASAVTYRLIKSRNNTGFLLGCLLLSILSPFLAIIFLISSIFNHWQSTYLDIALTLGAASCVSWLALFVSGRRHYIDIRPTEIYSSKINTTIKYNNVDDIVKYFEQGGAGDGYIKQITSSPFYAKENPVSDFQGDIHGLHINSSTGKSIDISRDYMASMESIRDLIAARVAMAKESPVIWS